jgi:hypothetical protein
MDSELEFELGRILHLWKQGKDTRDMAQILQREEWWCLRMLHKAREMDRRRADERARQGAGLPAERDD